MADLINQAYIRSIVPNVHIVTGIQFMPYEAQVDTELERLINLIGLAVYPCCLSLLLPVYIYNLVLEKETRLVETMKCNGLKMRTYWFVNYTFFFIIG